MRVRDDAPLVRGGGDTVLAAMLRFGGLLGGVGLVFAGACGSTPRDDTEDPPLATMSVSITDSMDASTGEPDSGEGTGAGSSSSDGGLILDVGNDDPTGVDPKEPVGCEKVDFLFVIDNSGSMGDEQNNLVSNFPGFIDTIGDELDDAQDYHIMVIDSDAYLWEACPVLCMTPPLGLPCTIGGFECGVTEPEECEDVLGAGVVHPKGSSSSNQDCAFSSGARYMDMTEPDLHAAFACAAQVGTGSVADPEKPMEAMVQAVTPDTEADVCNEGFIRDDAILVVTFITDEDDNQGDGSSGNVQGWRQALISAKNGDETAVVVLGLFGDQDQAGAICPPLDPESTAGAEPSPRLREFTESWGDRGFAGSVCAASYQEFFRDAVSIIGTTCDEFVPPAG